MRWNRDEITITADIADINQFKNNFIEEESQEIKGISASAGNARGKVKIVR